MFAFRTTWIVKEGKMEDALQLCRDTAEKVDLKAVESRVYTAYHSPNELVYEELWASIEEHDAFWEGQEGHRAALEKVGFWDAWGELMERATSTYVWKVERWP